MNSALVVGAQSGIAEALVKALLAQNTVSDVITVSRQEMPPRPGIRHLVCNHESDQIAAIANEIKSQQIRLIRVFICTGILHGDNIYPEKALQSLDPATMMEVLRINCVIPTLWLKALLPVLRGHREDGQSCVVTVFNARVGSIADNRKGGWYSYRTSKAALNMVLRTAAIEYARLAPMVKLLSFHPGTVDTAMSRPFSKNIASEALFAPAFVAERLMDITNTLAPDGTLSYLDWRGESIPW